MRTTHFFFVALVLALCLAPCAHSQVPDPAVAAAAPVPGAGHHYIGIGSETVNPADGLVHFDLPIPSPAGRQLSLPFGIRYGSSEQFYLRKQDLVAQSTLIWLSRLYTVGEQGGWSYGIPILTAGAKVQMFYTTYTGQPPQGAVDHQCDSSANYVFRGLDGVQHTLNLGGQWIDPQYTSTIPATQCDTTASGTSVAHGFTATVPNSWNWSTQPPITISDPSGTTYAFPGTTVGHIQHDIPPVVWALQPTTITDRNGNQLTPLGNSIKDTLGRTLVSWTGLGNDGDQVSVSGLTTPYTVHWANVPVSFPGTMHTVSSGAGTTACSLGSSSTSSAHVVSEIDLPNGQKYTFSYDSTYGRVSKIVFPGGGYVRYVWGLNPNSTAGYFDPVIQGVQYSCDVQYDTPAVVDRYVSYDGSTEVFHQHFVYSTAWNASSPWIWVSKSTTITNTDLLTNQATTTVHSYVPGGGDPGGPYSYAVGNNVLPMIVSTRI